MGSKSKSKNKNGAKRNPDANKAVEVAGNRVFGGGNKVITDDRFALSQKDPRFQDVPKHKTKVAIDSRFSRMFTDKNFSTSSARVDKRGRAKQDGDSSQSALKHYYRMDDEEKKQKKQPEVSDDDDDVESDEEKEEYVSDDAEVLKAVKQTSSKAKSEPELETESSGEDEDEDEEEEEEEEEEKGEEDLMDDDTTTDTDEDDEAYLEEETTGLQLEENVPEIDKETHRLAIVNLDWNQVQAVDLYVVLSSFLPKTGQILSVSVYPSEFGLKQMAEEAVRGPVGLFDDDNGKSNSDNSDDDNEIDNEKLRAYELSRLRYYFAVVVCDSVATADYIYRTCDGIEFERSSNMLDLRFIPDSMEFKHPPRDVATEAPANYEGVDFQTRALQQSKIDLTWDEIEPQRSKKLKRKINVDKESEYVKDEEQLKEFIASSESESEEEEEEDENNKNRGKRQKTDRYRALLQSGSNSDSDSDDTGMEMEVTFNTGLEDLSKKILEKKDKKSETVWDAYLRKKKEKKKARKSKSMDSDDSDDSGREPVEESGDFFAGDADKKDKKVKNLDKEGEASKEELELLLGDDDGNVKGYNLKRKKSKGQKGKREGMDEEKIPTVDYDDPRFSSLFTRPDYALDPTDPQFKRSAAYVREVAQKQHKGDMERKEEGEHNNDSFEQVQASKADDKVDSKKDKHEISMLLKSVKMKSKQLLLLPSSDAKKSKRKGK